MIEGHYGDCHPAPKGGKALSRKSLPDHPR